MDVSLVTHGLHLSPLEDSDSPYAWQWFFREIGVRLLVSKSVYDLFNRNRQFGKKHERGGLLFVHNNHRDGVVLCLATPPNSKDKSTRCSLDFDHERVIPPKRAASKSRINTSPAFSAGRVSLLKPSYAFALE